MDNFSSSLVRTVIDMVVPPDLNQARVNKCLIALVNRKIVTKDSSTVRGRGTNQTPFDAEISFSQRGQYYTIGKVWRHESVLWGCVYSL
jgi:hypothetical protein